MFFFPHRCWRQQRGVNSRSKECISQEECSASFLHVNWATDRRGMEVCETHGGGGKKDRAVNRKQRGGGGQGWGVWGWWGSPNPFLFSALSLLVKHTELDFTTWCFTSGLCVTLTLQRCRMCSGTKEKNVWTGPFFFFKEKRKLTSRTPP